MARHKHECVDCFDPQTIDIIRCVCSLERLIDDVFKCLSSRPSTRGIQQILACVLLNEVRKIEDLLTNETFGLSEIKAEVAQIESIVQALNTLLTSDLAAIANEVRTINSLVSSPVFGLQRIETDVQSIIGSINNSTFGLRKIETDIQAANSNIVSPAFGLQRIETDIQTLNSSITSKDFGLQKINTDVQTINSSITSKDFGLQRIETDVQTINSNIASPAFGLQKIDTGIQSINSNIASKDFGLRKIETDIQAVINNPVFGLQVIEKQIRAIWNIIGRTPARLTTGPVFINECARYLTVQVENNTSKPHTVQIKVMSIDKHPFQEIFSKSIEIQPFSINECRYIALDVADCCGNAYGEVEVIIDKVIAGIYPTAAQINEDDKIISSTIFKSADFVPKMQEYAS